MDDATFRAHVRERLGPLDDDATERALRTSLRVLGEACSRRVREHIADRLPPRFAAQLREVVDHDRGGDAIALVARIARLEGARPAVAHEHVSSVLSVVGECLDDEAQRLALSELPPDIGAMLQPRSRGGPPPAAHRSPPVSRHTLSSGRPGATDAVAGAHHPLAHVDSVDGVSHEDEHLSGARGTRQQQHHDTLAEGRSKRS